jgi:hypothetical protein
MACGRIFLDLLGSMLVFATSSSMEGKSEKVSNRILR